MTWSLIAIVFIYKVKIDIFKKQEVLFGFILGGSDPVPLIVLITVANGAHGWLFIGGVSIQPRRVSENSRVGLVLALRFSRKQEEIKIYDYQAF